jgi:hypothetical protein
MLFPGTHNGAGELADMLNGNEKADKTFKRQEHGKSDNPDNNV